MHSVGVQVLEVEVFRLVRQLQNIYYWLINKTWWLRLKFVGLLETACHSKAFRALVVGRSGRIWGEKARYG
jgi:hypothetical protein